jgi:hemerythrin-like domain-containing protein
MADPAARTLVAEDKTRGATMTILMADLLSDLHEDHRNMSIMLDLLSQQIDHIRDGERPDYELIHDIMRYMTTYSDAVHHPKEDILYSAMRAEKPELAKGLEQVAPEHEEIAALGETLRNDVEAVASGAAITRERLVTDTAEYVRTLRRHMAWEEEDLFRRARDLIRGEADMFIDISNFDRLDPVFGPEREHSFENLLRNIRNLSAAL